jgi:Mg-chelatase subunit ChlD
MSRSVCLIAAALLCACSASRPGSRNGGASAKGTSDGGAALGNGGSAGQGSGFGNASMGTAGARADASMPRALSADCVGQTQRAAKVDVDMYIMLDRSDSMREKTGAGPTKWEAIRTALTAFVQDSQSSGLGVGLQYFPLGAPGVPTMCNVDADCGAQGPCTNRACLPPRINVPFSFTQCLTDADCPAISPGCAPFGVCELDDTLACFNLGAGGCQAQGACKPISGECFGYSSCAVADYEAPAVAIGVLPDNASALTKSLMSEMPIGLTPTPVALQGAINRAAAHAVQNPTHRVIAVLATDGMPTQCLPQNVQTSAQAVTAVADIAAKGFAMTPAIETFVIGVFSPDDTGAMANLDQLAVAGGSNHAFIVDVSQDVSQQFIDALATIRGGSLDCEFQLPAPPTGAMLDTQSVNVELMQAGQTSTLLYVKSMDQCGKADLGWYYDADPPTKIVVCPKSCDTLRAAHDATIDVRLGCKTKGPL